MRMHFRGLGLARGSTAASAGATVHSYGTVSASMGAPWLEAAPVLSAPRKLRRLATADLLVISA